MKKTTIIFSFLLITIFSVGNYLLHLIYLDNYKQDFREYIIKHKKESALTNIEIKASELYVNSASISWEDDNQEIVYKNMLYDIIMIKSHGDYIIITIASDSQEMALKKEFASMYDVNSHSNTKGPFELLKNFLTLKYLMTDTSVEFIPFTRNTNLYFAYQLFEITTRAIVQDAPPPDLSI